MTINIQELPDELLGMIIRIAGPTIPVQCVSKTFYKQSLEVALNIIKALSDIKTEEDYSIFPQAMRQIRIKFPLADKLEEVAILALDALYKWVKSSYPNQDIHQMLLSQHFAQIEQVHQDKNIIKFSRLAIAIHKEDGPATREYLQSRKDSLGILPEKTLFFTERSLTRLAPEIFLFTAIKKLELIETSITFLPNEVFYLPNLEIILIQSTPLEILEIPKFPLAPIHTIDLSDTELREYPEDLEYLCNSLQKLTIGSRKIKIIPESLGKLTQLIELDLEETNLATLPSSLGSLPLTMLKINSNAIGSLPREITDSKNQAILAALPRFHCDLM